MNNWYGTFLELPRNPNFDEIIEGIDSLRKTIDQINDSVGLDMSTLDTSIKGNELGFFKIGWKAQAKGGNDAVPVVHARWEYMEDYAYSRIWWHCTSCRKRISNDMVAFAKYCPNCGAKMDGGEEE